jgi:hypothetical protein
MTATEVNWEEVIKVLLLWTILLVTTIYVSERKK